MSQADAGPGRAPAPETSPRTSQRGAGRATSDREPFRLLFVCTGNTCRSPMAEAIARDMIEKRGWTGVEVRSAGAGAFPGAPASGGALRVTAARGLDLGAHRATLLTPAEVARADLILTMSPSHLARVNDFGGGPRAALLTTYAEGPSAGGGSVPDPIGGSDREYELTCSRLEELVGKVIARLAPEVGA